MTVGSRGEPWARAGWRGGRGGPRLTFLLHASPEALLEPAVAALVPLVFVHHALPAKSGEGSGWLDGEGTALPLPRLTDRTLAICCSNASSRESPSNHEKGSMDSLRVHVGKLRLGEAIWRPGHSAWR